MFNLGFKTVSQKVNNILLFILSPNANILKFDIYGRSITNLVLLVCMSLISLQYFLF